MHGIYRKPYHSILTLNVNRVNVLIETQGHQMDKTMITSDPSGGCCMQETPFRPKDIYRLKVKGWRKIFYANRSIYLCPSIHPPIQPFIHTSSLLSSQQPIFNKRKNWNLVQFLKSLFVYPLGTHHALVSRFVVENYKNTPNSSKHENEEGSQIVSLKKQIQY